MTDTDKYNDVATVLAIRDDQVAAGNNAAAEHAQRLAEALIAPVAGAGPVQPVTPVAAPQAAPVAQPVAQPAPAPAQEDIDDLPF